MKKDIKIVAQLIISPTAMSQDQIHNNWIRNQKPQVNIRAVLATIFKVDISEVELRIRSEILYGPDLVILEVDSRRVQLKLSKSYEEYIISSTHDNTLVDIISIGLVGVPKEEIRIDWIYMESVYSVSLVRPHPGFVST